MSLAFAHVSAIRPRVRRPRKKTPPLLQAGGILLGGQEAALAVPPSSSVEAEFETVLQQRGVALPELTSSPALRDREVVEGGSRIDLAMQLRRKQNTIQELEKELEAAKRAKASRSLAGCRRRGTPSRD